MSGDSTLFPFSLFSLLIVGVPLLLLTSALLVQRQLAVERGQQPLFTQTSGGQVGWIRYRGPFIRLSLYEDFLVIRCWQTVVLRYDEIDRVDLTKWLGIVTDGVRLVHHGHAPGRIRLGSSDPARVKALIDTRLPTRPPLLIDPHYRLQ